MSSGRGCLAGFESFKTIFSLKNVAARLDSTRSVSLCQAINKNMKEFDRPVRRRFVTAGLYELTNARVQGWRSGESTRLPPMWSGFDSLTRRHMWVEFVGSLL